ncbi:uncharacterized protein LAJ45_10359 [Morchella importuna]|uniref:Large ribosomal subunit protein bL34m n=1 Tax=Morchella conica CCBAS932 TaxID=1392247 RepID=A0A3N4KNS7_9PEZI|nr:uncharacterized protein LAJ45_10359 [Morchella importuna]KAH8145559.1 hypothetical protein LAJ45_10359 [Morchella importuna]RPB12096.1 hypothetical protein P167DRAFT_523633 [Morchella conica CCBAS932]
MLCTRGITRAIRPMTSLPLKSLFKTLPARTFTSLTPLRPSIFPSISSGLAVPTNITSITAATTTIAPRISSHPALQALQVRNGPRNTFDPSHRVRKRRVGFLARKRTRGGRAVLKRRQLKGRRSLSH